MSVHKLASEKIRRWREAPDGVVQFCRELLRFEPDPWQADAFIKYQTGKQHTVMAACKNPGKTFTLGVIVWHFLVCYEASNVACTSISGDNLRDGLWKELAKLQARSEFLQRGFQWGAERIFAKERPGDWWASARKWSKTADVEKQADTLAGLHADYLLFVLDETGSMPRAVMAAAEAALGSGIVTRLVQAGNPTSLDGPLYDAVARHADQCNVIRVTGDPDHPMRAPRVSRQWALDMIKKYGRNNPWVKVNVFGEFPEANINALFSLTSVEEAMNRHLERDVYQYSQKRLGVDVARYGDDSTVLFPRQGLATFMPVEMYHKRGEPVSVDIANRVMLAKERWGWEQAFFDDTAGWAHGAIDTLRVNGHSPIALQFHGTSPDPKYKNLRAYGWMSMADWVERGGALPRINELIPELTSATYTFVGGKFMLEDKDLIKEKIGRSPNFADALATTFMIPDMPTDTQDIVARMLGKSSLSNQALHNYDPLGDMNQQDAGRAIADVFDPFEPGRNRI